MYPLKKRQWSWGTGEAEEGERARDKSGKTRWASKQHTHDDIVDYSLTRFLVSFCVVDFFFLSRSSLGAGDCPFPALNRNDRKMGDGLRFEETTK